MDHLINFLSNLSIDNATAYHFVTKLKSIRLNKHDHFQQEGEAARYMGFVISGKFRYYKTDKQGNEHTLWFNKSFPFIGDYHSFLKQTKAELSVQAMDDYEVILFTHSQLTELFNTNTHTLKLRAEVAERSMSGWRDIALALHFNTAEERYVRLLAHYPDIEKEIPLKYIATCLGISAETLSRIRKKQQENNPD